MDKEWMHLPSRLVPEYEEGVKKFITQAENYAKTREVFHGETYNSQSQAEDSSGGVQKVDEKEVGHTIFEAKDYEFDDLLKDVETPLFPGCTSYTKLSAVITLYNYKSTNGHTDNGFNELLKILGDMLPENITLPETVYTMRKLLKPFDLGYDKIHDCPNDCCLFRKELQDLDSCLKCGSSRWKIDKVTTKVCKRIPEKVLRYFPVIPRLKRMFKSKKKAEELIWHSKHKSQDHMMRHPVDSVAWDTIDHKWPDFASDPRNLRLGLATNVFNPFGDLSSRYSCWPVILVNYNLPPLLCMTKENLMLTLLIPCPKQPGNDIDVYLEPLVEDLKELWDTGVEAYDAFSKSMFNLKAILMWTINDFPAYGNQSGCATKRKLGCPICGEDICSMWLKYSRKFAYIDHRRFLAPNHPFRQKKKLFNRKKEMGKKKKSETINTLRKKRKKQDSSKVVQKPVKRNRLEQLEENVAETIFMLERFMKILKGYVKNRARPEGCIAECYLAEERMAFCNAYIKNDSSIGVRSNRNDDLEDGLLEGRPISKGKEKILEDHVLQAAHRYVLFNTAEVEHYLQIHIDELKQSDHRFLSNETLLQKKHMETFAEWLSKLSHGPRKHVPSYTGYIVNGHRFHTIDVGV
ncbi:uncharacterized protein LOC142541901 [Primulina tabacum]|uniref:uncharacterized protein LOC142541901 n=1 Tax=Primulina tabacum TaxID=48773 RepID=UPI003F592FF5